MTEGRVLAGRYKLISQLGRGGMGSVWRAVHTELGTPAAIKLVDPALAESGEALARFKLEAQVAAKLRSAHVVQIFDYGLDSDTPYIAMELMKGETLAERLDRKGPLPPAVLIAILKQVGKALTSAHGLGIVHRDLKPENIFLTQDAGEEVAKVLDFGIAKACQPSDLQVQSRTRTGALLGTPSYMSPEQASGKKAVDYRTDIWALGVIAYECLTGYLPFDADNVGALILAICTEPIPTPSHVAPVPPPFDAWFSKAAARDPEARFQSVAEALAALEVALKTTTPEAPRREALPVAIPDLVTEAKPRAGPAQPGSKPQKVEAHGTAASSQEEPDEFFFELAGPPTKLEVYRSEPPPAPLPELPSEVALPRRPHSGGKPPRYIVTLIILVFAALTVYRLRHFGLALLSESDSPASVIQNSR